MKKLKALSVLLSVALLLCLCLTGCSSTDTSPLFDQSPPWAYGEYDCTETCTYELSRYLQAEVDESFVLAGEDKSKGYKLNSFGELTYTLKEGVSVRLSGGEIEELESPDTANCTLITMNLTVVYKSDLSHIASAAVRAVHEGKTDTMTSYAVIDRYNLSPLFTYKDVKIGAQQAGDSKSYTLTADYTGGFTGKKEAKLSDSRGSFVTEIRDGVFYDSESIYYIIRAMRSIRTSGTTSRTLDIASPYDDLLTGAKRLTPKGASASTEATLSRVAVAEDVYGLFNVPAGSLSEDFKLDCFKTGLALTAAKSGPTVNLYFSAVPTKESTRLGTPYSAEKLLIGCSYENHDKSTDAVYFQEFILSGYTNEYLK